MMLMLVGSVFGANAVTVALLVEDFESETPFAVTDAVTLNVELASAIACVE